MVVIVDSSVWIDVLAGNAVLDTAGNIVLPPLVVAELLTGENTAGQLEQIGELLQDFPLHHTPLHHWINVGYLRRMLRSRGINATIPDAHIAQCAMDLDAVLLSRDEIFRRIASHTPLRLARLR